ncbi:hypothetical protein [Lacticaseibacillus mingshuiensis]|uniref:Transposase n=1 Tax=Lacticaseibacillus mingshuiensis TaxID=2799574 RepID=A0ABW4CHE0_9LACO|nr:hypothetical protein [Lacticaseibacillus mingshuiensis]
MHGSIVLIFVDEAGTQQRLSIDAPETPLGPANFAAFLEKSAQRDPHIREYQAAYGAPIAAFLLIYLAEV